jgi:hypothetical protein
LVSGVSTPISRTRSFPSSSMVSPSITRRHVRSSPYLAEQPSIGVVQHTTSPSARDRRVLPHEPPSFDARPDRPRAAGSLRRVPRTHLPPNSPITAARVPPISRMTIVRIAG